MSSIDTNVVRTYTSTPSDNEALLDELNKAKKEGTVSLQEYITQLGTILGEAPQFNEGAPILKSPELSILSAADLTLRIAILQDALNQLQQQVSKLEIESRLNELEQNNKDQLNKIMKQIEEAEEALRKQEEAQKKSNVFE